MSSKEGPSGSQRLEACEALRSQEISGAWVGHDQRCYGVPLPWSQRRRWRITLDA
jgi:hypothetical protein